MNDAFIYYPHFGRARRELGEWSGVVENGAWPAAASPDSAASARPPLEQRAAEAWAAVEAFNRAFAENDPNGYFGHIAEEITVLTPGSPYRVEGVADDRAGFEHALQAGYGRVAFFQALQPCVQVYGEVAVASYFTRGRYGPPGQERLHYLKETDVLVRRAGAWQVVHIHVSATSS